MNKTTRAIAFATLVGATIIGATGCSVARNQQTVGSYVDDAGITTAVKAKFAEDKNVAATSISVETLKGTVQLSGFAKSRERPCRITGTQCEGRGIRAQQHRGTPLNPAPACERRLCTKGGAHYTLPTSMRSAFFISRIPR